MATGACGIDCNACRVKIRGLCMGCGAATGSIAQRRLEAQHRIFRQCCPILKCARDHHVAVGQEVVIPSGHRRRPSLR